MLVATAFQKDGRLDEADEIYGKLLELAPDHPGVRHYAGVLAHQRGESDHGVALIEQSLALQPDQADCYSNLGIIFKAQGKVDEAVAAYERAIALNPTHAGAYCNLGVLLSAQGKPTEAEAAYRSACRLDPTRSDVYQNLGILLHRQQRTREAAECFCRVTTLAPQHPEARRLLALAHCALGEVDKAVEIFERWLRDEPDNPVARHMLAACTGADVPPRASDAYIEKVFDDFAESFDAKLEVLSYRAPTLVATMLGDSGFHPAKNLDVLDAGCGTGLCGPLVAPYARRLVGVDLSEQMLAQAKARAVYDELVKGELTAYLGNATEAYDVIVSADTLVYFGPLEAVAAAAANALRPAGALIFTVEDADVDAQAEETNTHMADAVPGYRIATNGRYTHTREYVAQALAAVGLESEIVPAELRMESGMPVAGLLVRGSKRATSAASPGSPGANHG